MAEEDTNGSGRRDAGDRLIVGYIVTNTSKVPLAQVKVADAAATSPITCPSRTLAPGTSMTCTAAHRLSQQDLDAGSVSFAPTVAAVDPAGHSVTAAAQPKTETLAEVATLTASQWVTLTRDRNGNGRIEPGDGVTYHMTVVNTGNVTVSSLSVTDSLLQRYGLSLACSPTTLAPGQKSWCVSGVLNVTQGQAARGTLTNWATPGAVTARGRAFNGGTTTSSVQLFQLSVMGPAGRLGQAKPILAKAPKAPKAPRVIRKLALSQSRLSVDDVNGNGALTPGETLRFGFVATNSGNTTLYGLHIVDGRLDEVHVPITCADTTLAPGAVTNCASGPVTVTKFQGQLSQGFGTNYAYAVATDFARVSVRSNNTEVYQGYFISDLRETALVDTGTNASSPVLAGLGLIGMGSLFTLLAKFGSSGRALSRIPGRRRLDRQAEHTPR